MGFSGLSIGFHNLSNSYHPYIHILSTIVDKIEKYESYELIKVINKIKKYR